MAIRRSAWVALLFLALSGVMLHPLSTRFDRLPDNADALQNCWAVSWLAHAALTDPARLLDGNVLHPEKHALLFSEPVIGPGLLAVPTWAATRDPIVTHNVTLVLTLAMAAFTMFLLGRELTGSTLAGVVAGEIFALTTANLDSVARIQLISSQWTPLLLFFLARLQRRGRLADGIGAGVAFALQGLSCTYYELFLAVLLVLCSPLFLWARRPGIGLGRFAARLAAGVVVAGVLLLPLVTAQWDALQAVDTNRLSSAALGPSAYLNALPENWIYGGSLGYPLWRYEARHFTGFAPLVLGAAGLIAARGRWRRRYRRLVPILALGLIALLLAIGESASLFGLNPFVTLREAIPGLQAVRVPERFNMFVRVALALLAAVAVREIAVRGRAGGQRRKAWSALGVAVAVIAPLEHASGPLPSWRLPARSELPGVYAALADLGGDGRHPLVEFPPQPVRLRRGESLWQYLSTFHWQPIVNGYPSLYPTHYDFLYDTLQNLPSGRSIELLRTLGVEYLVFHPGDPEHQEGRRMVRRFERHVDRFTQLEEVARFTGEEWVPTPWRPLGNERLYRIRPREGPGPRRTRLADLVEVSTAGAACEANPAERCELALDGDPSTFWRTGETQTEAHFFRVILPRTLRVRGVGLEMGLSSLQYPRTAVLYGLDADGWRGLTYHFNAPEFLVDTLERPRRATMEYVLDPAELQALEIRIEHPFVAHKEWRLPELRLYE